LPNQRRIFVYCTCVRQATSTRVARELQKMLEGQDVHVSVIRGGLRAWARAGLPVEAVPREEMQALPLFE
jgi:rhodanese-related sulfurtransferase